MKDKGGHDRAGGVGAEDQERREEFDYGCCAIGVHAVTSRPMKSFGSMPSFRASDTAVFQRGR